MTVRRSTALTIAAALAVSAPLTAAAGEPPAEAAPHPLCAGAEEGVECVVVVIDHLRQIALEDAVKTLLIGNPAIADVNLIGPDQAVITARAVGSTNIFFLDADNAPIAKYRVFVRETDAKRVMLRRGPSEVSQYQCAPRCERTLSQNDSATAFSEQRSKVTGASALASGAAGEGGE